MSNPQPSQEGDPSLADTNSRGTRIYYPQGLRYKVHIIQILPTILVSDLASIQSVFNPPF